MQISKEHVKEIVYKVLPVYIKNHPEIREFLEKLVKECPYKKTSEDRFEKLLMEIKLMREESQRKWEENQRKWEENQKRWEENQKRWEEEQRRWEENQRRWEENDRRWKETQEEIKRLHRLYDVGVGALGARWGIKAESTFREAIKGILEESFPVKVERFLAKDETGEVFGQPDQVELDLIIKNGEVIAAEIKSSMSKSDVYIFDRKVKFYEKKEGRKVSRKLIISPMVEDSARRVAENLGIEVYTYPDYIESL